MSNGPNRLLGIMPCTRIICSTNGRMCSRPPRAAECPSFGSSIAVQATTTELSLLPLLNISERLLAAAHRPNTSSCRVSKDRVPTTSVNYDREFYHRAEFEARSNCLERQPVGIIAHGSEHAVPPFSSQKAFSLLSHRVL